MTTKPLQFSNQLVLSKTKLGKVLKLMDNVKSEGLLFIVNKDIKLLGSITDGDVRRSLLKENITIDTIVDEIMECNPKKMDISKIDLDLISRYRNSGYKKIPLVNNKNVVIEILNFNKLKTKLPLDVLIMAGGEGRRLRPLTEKTPKPLLKVNGVPIIKRVIDQAVQFGINKFHVSVGYLGEQIVEYLSQLGELTFNIVKESKPLGTIGSVSLISQFEHENLLLTNADLLTEIDFEDFYFFHNSTNSDITILSVPYNVKIPFGVLDSNDNELVSISEKPSINFLTNGGVYIIKTKCLKLIPSNIFFNATDLINKALEEKKLKISTYKFEGIWNDIGNHEDYNRVNTIKN